jgi:hypothetical protein
MLKQIDGFTRYFIDEEGNVYKKLKPGGKKYLSVILNEGRKFKTLQIHRAVAEYFVPNPNNKPIVNHINEDTYNNNYTNLEWCTQKENVYHSLKGKDFVRNFAECELYKDGELIGHFKSVSEACRFCATEYGISYYQINRLRDYKGFKIVKKV